MVAAVPARGSAGKLVTGGGQESRGRTFQGDLCPVLRASPPARRLCPWGPALPEVSFMFAGTEGFPALT